MIVPPAASRPELVDLEVASRSGLLQLTCEMKNAGERHVRPLVMWSIRRAGAKEVDARGKLEATVLMPFSRVREPHALAHEVLPPGDYEVSVLVDFQDKQPLQSMTKTVSITPDREVVARSR